MKLHERIALTQMGENFVLRTENGATTTTVGLSRPELSTLVSRAAEVLEDAESDTGEARMGEIALLADIINGSLEDTCPAGEDLEAECPCPDAERVKSIATAIVDALSGDCA